MDEEKQYLQAFMKNSWKDETPLTWEVFSFYGSVECGQELSLGCVEFKMSTKWPSLGWQWVASYSVAREKGWARDGNSSHHRRTEQKQLDVVTREKKKWNGGPRWTPPAQWEPGKAQLPGQEGAMRWTLGDQVKSVTVFYRGTTFF